MTLSEEEANAELERLQQRITLNLQEIDRNFAECNQVITSRTIPEVERYTEASTRIWNHCKIWLYFFKSMDKEIDPNQSNDSTNRPPHSTDAARDDNSVWNQQMNHDVSAIEVTNVSSSSQLRKALLQKSQESSVADKYKSPAETAPSISLSKETPADDTSDTNNDNNDDDNNNNTNNNNNNTAFTSVSSASNSTHSTLKRTLVTSPPRTIPFGKAPSSLVGTPIRDAAEILATSVFESVGIRSSDDDMVTDDDTSSKRHKSNSHEGKAWDETNIMDVDNVESRERFSNFILQRENRPLNMYEELPTLRSAHASPSNRDYYPPTQESALANTPTMDRVLNSKERDLRRDNHISEEYSSSDVGGAYEFSDAMLPQERFQTAEKQSNSGGARSESDLTFTSGSNITMISGNTGQIPAKFDLQYFPQKFRLPPASSQLIRIHSFFADRPGSLLTLQDVIDYINEPEYTEDNVSLLIHLLTRKKFLKRVGGKDAWTIRR